MEIFQSLRMLMQTYEMRPRVINGSLLVGSSELESVPTGGDGTYMSGGFTTSLVCQDTSGDEDANGQSLCPHTSLNNLPNTTNQSGPPKGDKDTRLSRTFCDVV